MHCAMENDISYGSEKVQNAYDFFLSTLLSGDPDTGPTLDYASFGSAASAFSDTFQTMPDPDDLPHALDGYDASITPLGGVYS